MEPDDCEAGRSLAGHLVAADGDCRPARSSQIIQRENCASQVGAQQQIQEHCHCPGREVEEEEGEAAAAAADHDDDNHDGADAGADVVLQQKGL